MMITAASLRRVRVPSSSYYCIINRLVDVACSSSTSNNNYHDVVVHFRRSSSLSRPQPQPQRQRQQPLAAISVGGGGGLRHFSSSGSGGSNSSGGGIFDLGSNRGSGSPTADNNANRFRRTPRRPNPNYRRPVAAAAAGGGGSKKKSKDNRKIRRNKASQKRRRPPKADPLAKYVEHGPGIVSKAKGQNIHDIPGRTKEFASDFADMTSDYEDVLDGLGGHDDYAGMDPRRRRLIRDFGLTPYAADLIRQERREIQHQQQAPANTDPVEEHLRMIDFMTAEDGSTEENVGIRRALERDLDTPAEREQFLAGLDQIIDNERNNMMVEDDPYGLMNKDKVARRQQYQDLDAAEEASKLGEGGGETAEEKEEEEDASGGGVQDLDMDFDPNARAHGEWGVMLVSVDRNVKLWRGGRQESFRSLVIGGNLNGCGGFATGKAKDAMEAIKVATRKCRRNIYFVERYQNSSITRDLVGTQNSCIVHIRATTNGLSGTPLVQEILKRFGITNAMCKTHGNRNPYNIVRATFKALATHESLDEIAMKRGKRLVSIDRMLRMQV